MSALEYILYGLDIDKYPLFEGIYNCIYISSIIGISWGTINLILTLVYQCVSFSLSNYYFVLQSVSFIDKWFVLTWSYLCIILKGLNKTEQFAWTLKHPCNHFNLSPNYTGPATKFPLPLPQSPAIPCSLSLSVIPPIN